jgi:hypothetical protein
MSTTSANLQRRGVSGMASFLPTLTWREKWSITFYLLCRGCLVGDHDDAERDEPNDEHNPENR